jgi:hypothetical protein
MMNLVVVPPRVRLKITSSSAQWSSPPLVFSKHFARSLDLNSDESIVSMLVMTSLMIV